MPAPHDSDIVALRMAYNVASSAHADIMRMWTDAVVHSEPPPAELVEAEAKARTKKEEARRALFAAMARAAGPPPDPPELSGRR